MGEAILINHYPTKKELFYTDDYTTIGNTRTLEGAIYKNTGYFGVVNSSQLFTGSALASTVGITIGTLINDSVTWLKFYIDKKIIFVAQKPIRYSVSWNAINTAGCIDGTKTVSKNGVTFKVRLMSGSSINPSIADVSDKSAKGSDWNRLILPIHSQAKNKTWTYPDFVEDDIPNWDVNFSDTDLGTTSSNGSESWCQERIGTITGMTAVTRGGGSVTNSGGGLVGNTSTSRGWRPVLEVVPK